RRVMTNERTPQPPTESRCFSELQRFTESPPRDVSRRLVLAGLLTSCGVFFTRSATAGAAIPIRLDELLGQSEHVLVGTPRQSEAMWERVGDTRRIVTYTRLAVAETLDGSEPKDGELF